MRLTLETDLGCIRRNALEIKSRLKPGVKMMAVVKADAYGHGSMQVARDLEQNGLADAFSVATADEGVCLRNAGIKSDILILGYSDEEDLLKALTYNLSATVYSKEMLLRFKALSEACKITGRAHLKIETGMNRLGISNEDALNELLNIWKNTPQIRMEGVFSHFSSADSDEDYTAYQFERFLKSVSLINSCGFHPIRHIAASSALFSPAYQLDMVRAGIALYGVGDQSVLNNLRTAQRLISHPVRFHMIKKGEKAGYSQSFTAERDTLVMTVPCGYGDGYPRLLGNKAYVLVNGKRARVIGNVCMDMLLVDATDLGKADENTEIVLMGRQGNDEILPQELAGLSHTIPYEIMLGFTARVHRTWLK